MSDIKSHDKTATRPQTATGMTQSPLSRIVRRTRGQSHGPITRLMSPSDFGRLLKPFVFLDLFDTHGKPSLVVSASIRIPASQPYLEPEGIPNDGPAHVLLGSYGTATSAIKAPSPINYLAVRLKAGERWSYQPPAEHTVLWTAVGMGSVLVPDELEQGELVAFSPSSAAIEFEANSMRSSY